jgi:hypothetical protein
MVLQGPPFLAGETTRGEGLKGLKAWARTYRRARSGGCGERANPWARARFGRENSA